MINDHNKSTKLLEERESLNVSKKLTNAVPLGTEMSLHGLKKYSLTLK
jgi:hypothetical protein